MSQLAEQKHPVFITCSSCGWLHTFNDRPELPSPNAITEYSCPSCGFLWFRVWGESQVHHRRLWQGPQGNCEAVSTSDRIPAALLE